MGCRLRGAKGRARLLSLDGSMTDSDGLCRRTYERYLDSHTRNPPSRSMTWGPIKQASLDARVLANAVRRILTPFLAILKGFRTAKTSAQR